MRSSLLESVIITEFQATEAYSNLDLTKAKYSMSTLSVVEKVVYELTLIVSLHEKKEINMMMKMKFTISIQYIPRSLIQPVRNINEFPSLCW
jgi:hypothetical protein